MSGIIISVDPACALFLMNIQLSNCMELLFDMVGMQSIHNATKVGTSFKENSSMGLGCGEARGRSGKIIY